MATNSELADKAKKLGIILSVDDNFLGQGPCVLATHPTHQGRGCDSVLVWLTDGISREDAETRALEAAIRDASPAISDSEAHHEE
ncbi:hypothetical protein BFS14_02035 [Serratia fonticola]|uniref:hypothetical protein n=1 Tax=Serratia fonticola TaxID=47917 RepID=UPI0008FD7569|nr:hypothetical protein [Serratia fonticola]OIX96267.1 hypothetical protein BFS14_02035 [Serratia fonticola]QCR60811.1 hypothetical protein FD644_10735 [Serratia fonticola]